MMYGRVLKPSVGSFNVISSEEVGMNAWDGMKHVEDVFFGVRCEW